MELAGYTIERGSEGEITLTRAKPPFDWRVLPVVLAGVSIVVPFALSFVSGDASWYAGFFAWLATPFVFLMVSSAYAAHPTLLEIARRMVLGETGPNGQRMVRVDERTWPAGEGVDVLVCERHVSPKNGPSYKIDGVLVVLPDAVVELTCGREKKEQAKQLQHQLCAALAVEPPKGVLWRQTPEDAELVFVFVGIAAVMLAFAPPIASTFVELPHPRALILGTGVWTALIAWASSRIMGAMLRRSGPALLAAAKESAASARK